MAKKEINVVKLLNIRVYTDGACSGNPGPGGWAALLLIKSEELGVKEKVAIKGGEKNTTNNRMELVAVIEALEFIAKNLKGKYKFNITIYSDSAYVCDTMNLNRILTWQRNGWRKLDKSPVKNKDLWMRVIELDNKLSPAFEQVKGHADNKFNNYVDKVAVEESNKYKHILKGL